MIREMLLDLIGDRPRLAATLFEQLRDQLGSVQERRLWRALDWLIRAGHVCVLGRKKQQAQYVRRRVRRCAGRINFSAPLRTVTKKARLLA